MPYTPEPLPTYTFKNGAVATVHQIGQLTIAKIAAGVEAKTPAVPIPTFDVDDLKNQPKPSDPDYQKAVAERRSRVNMRVMEKMIELAVDIEIDRDVLDHLKAGLERIDEPLDEISDKVAYIKHCCIVDVQTELGKLSSLITGDLEEATSAATATFSSDLPGPPADTLESASLRGPVLAEP